jgi:hypothetical protein
MRQMSTSAAIKLALGIALVVMCESRVAAGPVSYLAIPLGTLGGSASVGFGINDSGQTVGYSYTSIGLDHAFLIPTGPCTI